MIYKTLVGSDDGKILQADTIQFENGLWLVPEWLESPSEAATFPARIIRIDTLRIQKGGPGVDFVLNDPIPRAVLEGKTTGQFIVVDRPKLSIKGGHA